MEQKNIALICVCCSALVASACAIVLFLLFFGGNKGNKNDKKSWKFPAASAPSGSQPAPPRTVLPKTTEYTEHPRLSLIGTKLKVQNVPNGNACKALCTATPGCTWAELHPGNMCVVKSAVMPAECNGETSSKRCADGYVDGATLYNPKGRDSGLTEDGLAAVKKALDAWEEEATCKGTCKVLAVLGIIGMVLNFIPMGGLMGVALAGISIAETAAEVGVSIAEGKSEKARTEQINKGIVRTNIPEDFAGVALCRKDYRKNRKGTHLAVGDWGAVDYVLFNCKNSQRYLDFPPIYKNLRKEWFQ